LTQNDVFKIPMEAERNNISLSNLKLRLNLNF